MTDPLETLQARLAIVVLEAQDELARAVRDLALCHADASRRVGLEQARRAVAKAVNTVRATGDLAARVAVRFPGAVAAPPALFATFHVTAGIFDAPQPTDPVPDVGFDEAVDALQRRDPVGAEDLTAIGASVADLYAGAVDGRGEVVYPGGFAAARAADRDTAKHVQTMLVEGLEGGTPTPAVVERLVKRWAWPASYSETVVRTNYNTATTSGRFAEAERIERTSGIRVGFVYRATADSDVRRGRPQDHGENHLALDGLVARQDDPCWQKWSPPGGFSCRCTLEVVVGDEVPEGFVTVPAGAAFAPGFGHRH